MNKKLEPKQIRFCEEYIVDRNGAQAAIRAGYSPKTAIEQASRLLTKAHVQQYLNELIREQADRTKIKADRVLNEIGKLAFSDIRKIFDADGKLLPAHMLPDEIAASIASIEVVTNIIPGTKPVEVEYTSKIKFWDKRGSLELLGKHLKLFTEKVEHTGKDGEPLEITDTQAIARMTAIIDAVMTRVKKNQDGSQENQ